MAEEKLNVADEANEAAEAPAEKKKTEPPKDIWAILRGASKGTLKLMQPIRAASRDITEIDYDFCALTGEELLDALDSVPAINYTAITNLQALAIFSAAAEKCAPFVSNDGANKTLLYDARDIRKRLSGVDALRAGGLAKGFYRASLMAANSGSSNA